MPVLRTILSLLAFVCLQAYGQTDTLATQADRVASGIRVNYESGLNTLPLSLQRHYAQRIYRMTGDERFLPYLEQHAEQLLKALFRDVHGLTTQPGYALARDQAISATQSPRTERQRQRAALLAAHPGMSFATNLTFRMVQLEYYGLLEALPTEDVALLKAYLSNMDFANFLLSDEAIRFYAAQAANYAWFLHQLGVMDLRDAFMRRFQAIYPAGEDAALSRAEWHNKLYGMTHIVIAASRYYQQLLPQDTFAWITDDFIRQLPTLLNTATEDILAEVGISLTLTRQVSHPAVEQIRQALINVYDPDTRMIPSPTGSTDFARGEHRNVLAVMLLIWPEQLHAGPKINDKTLAFYQRFEVSESLPENTGN